MGGKCHALLRCTLPVVLSIGSAGPLAAQDTPAQETPLSVIDWLQNNAASPQRKPTKKPIAAPKEPPVAASGTAPTVTTTPLSGGAPREIGLVPPDVTGLPHDLWVGSDPARLIDLIERLPDPGLPATQALLYTVLLAEGLAPGSNATDGDALALARVRKLVDMGALDPALSLIEQAGATTSSAHFDLWMQISLLTGTEDRACSVLATNPHLTADYGTRIFCATRAQQWDNAALTLGSAQALGLMSDDRLALMDRFLHPEESEGSDPLVQPRQMDPLSFRLFEAIGEPLSTRALPRAYAVADLRDLAGWKSQLEAAERLTRAGALPDNLLLGFYTDREPAASGGIWDRVEALQRFETALATRNAEAVAKALPGVWTAMTEAQLEVAFASLFTDQLAAFNLEGQAGEIAFDIALLSPNYETAAAQAKATSLAGHIAVGEAPGNRPDGPAAAAIYDAFSTADPRADLVASARQSRLGEAILQVLDLLHVGARGNATALRDGLATLRALGLEDTARRTALQILLLER